MPIFKSTVFVLGAGASAHYRLPLGIALRDSVLTAMTDSPLRTYLMELGHSPDEIETFRMDLQYSGLTSVDKFLELNSTYLAIGKRAIAGALLPCEREYDLFPPGVTANGHWYEYLINLMGPDASSWNRNKLSVITFNYDRTFEHYFSTVLAQRRNIPRTEAWTVLTDIVSIVHPHGSLGEYGSGPEVSVPFGADLTAEIIRQSADSISIVSETVSDSEVFSRAEQLLRGADQVLFLGFGFHDVNVRRLKIFDEHWMDDKERPWIGGTALGFSPKEWTYLVNDTLSGLWDDGHHTMTPLDYLKQVAELE